MCVNKQVCGRKNRRNFEFSSLRAGAAGGLRQSEARHRHVRFWRSRVGNEGGMPLPVRHQRGLSRGGRCRHSPGKVGIIIRTFSLFSVGCLIFFIVAREKKGKES